MCDTNPHGPQGAVDWSAEIGGNVCDSADGYDNPRVGQVMFGDATRGRAQGRGRRPQLRAYLHTPVPGDVLLYDGASPLDAPVRLQSLFRADPVTAEFGTASRRPVDR